FSRNHTAAPRASFGQKLVPINRQWIPLAGIFAVVSQETFAGDDVRLTISIHLAELECVWLRPGGVDRVRRPDSSALDRRLFHPPQSRAMAASPDDIGIAVGIYIGDDDRHAGIAVEIELAVPNPTVFATIDRSFEPAFGTDQIAAAVTVDVAPTDA